MIWLLLSALALATAPEGVDLEDIFSWEDAAEPLLDGPPGCWNMEGTAVRKVVVFIPPDLWTSGSQLEEVVNAKVRGRLLDGRWQFYGVNGVDRGDLKSVNPLIRILPSIVDQLDIIPLIGAFPGVGERSPTNLVRKIVDEWGGDLSTSITEWDDERNGVWLRREVPIRKKPRAPVSQVSTFFPEGKLTPTEMDVAFPASFKAGLKLMRFRIDNAQFHIRAAQTPTLESASLLLIGMGITMGYEQTITYDSFTPCDA